jgi:hypothetical protein
MRRRPIAVIAAVGAVAALGSGAALAAGGTPPADTALLVGRYQDGQQIALTNLTVPDGSYAVAYGAAAARARPDRSRSATAALA